MRMSTTCHYLRTALFAILSALGLSTLTSRATAQDLPDLQQRLLRALSVANGNAHIVLSPVPLALDPWMDTETIANQEALADVLDAAFDGEPLRATQARLSSAYFDVLSAAEWALSSLTTDQRRQLASVARVLFSDAARTVPTAKYREYLGFKTALEQLQRKWDDTPPSQRSASLAIDLENARADLALHDEGGTYSTAESTYETLTRRPPPTARRTQLRDRYNAALLTTAGARQVPRSDLGPSYAATVQGDTWTELEITNFSDAATLGAVWGRVASDGTVTRSSSRATRLALRFSVAAVPIARPWFDDTLFVDRFWRWPDASHPPISDPTRPPGNRGRVPHFATHALLATNVVVDANLSSAEWADIQRAVLESQTLLWGPFMVSGRYFDPQRRVMSARRVGTTLRIPDVQIIGWLVEAVPKSPDPDRRLEWPGIPALHANRK